MDPISVISLTTNIIQFVEFGFKITRRLSEYTRTGLDDIPKALQTIATQLPLLLNALQRVKLSVEDEKLDVDTRCILKGVVSGCMSQVAQVEKIMDQVLTRAGDSMAKKARKAFISLQVDEKLLVIEKSLQTYISVLILHHVIDDTVAATFAPVEKSYFEVPLTQASPFVERDDLIQVIDQHLQNVKTSQVPYPVTVVLYGEAGVGKTQLALEYCRRSNALGQFKTVFWLDSSSPQSLRYSLESAAAVVRQSKEGTPAEKLKFMRTFLSRRWHPWLLVLHRYSEAAFENILDLLPAEGSAAYIFTVDTRERPKLANIVKVPKFLTLLEQKELAERLSSAIEQKQSDKILQLIANGASVHSTMHFMPNWPCINRAALHGLAPVVRLFLERGADPRKGTAIGDGGGWTALHWAASNGHIEVVGILLDHEGNTGTVRKAPDYDAPMRVAATEGHTEVLRVLLDRRPVNLESKEYGTQTVLNMAAAKGHTNVVKLLLEKGINPDGGDPNKSPLLQSVQERRFETARALIAHRSLTRDPSLREDLDRCLIDIELFREVGWSTTVEKIKDMIEYLLDLGANPNASPRRRGALHNAVIFEFEEIARLLVRRGAQPWLKDDHGRTVLDIALENCNERLVSLLLEANIPDPKIQQAYLDHAIQYCARNKKRDMALLMLEAGATVNSLDGNGTSPLLLSIDAADVPTARLLVRRGARHDLSDKNGRLPLLVAAENGHHLLVRDLVRSSKAPNISNKNGDTALCLAAAKGHVDVVKVLLDNGADRDLTNKFGEIALDLAEEKGHNKVIEVLDT